MGKKVVFAKSLALTGIFCGLAIALGVPFLAFAAAKFDAITSGGAIAITIISVLAGAAIVLVSAFFGIVIPSTVEKSENEGHGHHHDEKSQARSSGSQTSTHAE